MPTDTIKPRTFRGLIRIHSRERWGGYVSVLSRRHECH